MSIKSRVGMAAMAAVFLNTSSFAACNTEFAEAELEEWMGKSQSKGIDRVPLGEFEIVQKGGNVDRGTIDFYTLEEALAFRNAGLVTIEYQSGLKEPVVDNKQEWQVWLKELQRGNHRISISATSSGMNETESIGASNDKNSITIGASQEPSTLLELKRSRIFDKGPATHAMVLYTYQNHWNEIFLRVRRDRERLCSLTGRSTQCSAVPSDQGKSKLLLKLDDFTCAWKWVAQDNSSLESDFKSTKVDDAVRQLE